MYYKINSNILFRQYNKYGYITDNSLFGYRALNDTEKLPGEEYISESGAVMLSMLDKTPQHIDAIIEKLICLFTEVEFKELKQDTIDFYNIFVDKGFLSRGKTFDECDRYRCVVTAEQKDVDRSCLSMREDVSDNFFDKNDFLRGIHIEIANECNERCVHCYIPHECKNKMISPNLFYRIINESREMNIINITISGGEPLLHKDFIPFLAKCRDLDFSVNVLTNLTMLTDEIISEMKKNPLISVQTSVYSMDPLVHDSITKVNGSFEKTKNALLKLKDVGIPVQISCPIMKQNLETFNDVITFGRDNDIAVATDYVIFASYDHSNYNLTNRLSLEEVEKAFDKHSSNDYINNLRDMAKEKMLLTEQDPICMICRYYICISADGKAFPCIGWQDNVIGDLNKQTLREVCENSKEIQRLKQIKRKDFPKCVNCENRGYCTVCMMSNSNESSNADAFAINDFHCKVAAMIHHKVDSYINTQSSII